jgi:GNAT superfamily N-acetyltransferase
MSAMARLAGPEDLLALGQMDRHVSGDDLAELISAGRVMVVEVEGLLVGCLRWSLFWDEVPFINLLWILPDWRGRGIGRALVEAWETSQSAAGHTLVLTSTVSAEPAQHFYRRLGYADSGVLLLPDEAAELFFRKTVG